MARRELPRDRRQYLLAEALKRGLRAVAARDMPAVLEAVQDARVLAALWEEGPPVVHQGPRRRFIVRGHEREWRAVYEERTFIDSGEAFPASPPQSNLQAGPRSSPDSHRRDAA